MSYKKEKVFGHLAKYKCSVLNTTECGYWEGNKKYYSYILPNDKFEKNIIRGKFGDILINMFHSSSMKKHLGFHHLNSSQALAFNLFAPAIYEEKLDLILKHIDFDDVVDESEFEHIEDKKEFTNFDFYIKGRDRKYFFEVKYTEGNFGSVADDDSHKEKYEKLYKNDLKNISEISKKSFFEKYQLWRNILYSKNSDVVIFVIPRFRTDLSKEIDIAIKSLKKDNLVKVLYIDEICSLFSSLEDVKLKSHYEEFKRKYLDINFL